ncbi:hypothetical protein [Serratia sp. Se-RSBMAAmG]|uniref:hypothetical protein n=1 Tax=Serratia sp. Se-RSBMAAmG TaxID=3043305 RepID=UPI0024AE8B5C|nr:hypothetical protein [Serratia sp. Se-RSBMAAmG]MDI6976174.1 hypothetical protein [Serratia sp. Se-RSBMAAmG]
MKKFFKVLTCVCLALMLSSCDSPEEQKSELKEVAAKNQVVMNSPLKVGVLSNGQTLYLVKVEYYQPFGGNDTHYVYYTDGGLSVSDNHKTNDKFKKNLTQVSLSSLQQTEPRQTANTQEVKTETTAGSKNVLLPENATEDDILKAAEKIKADKELQKDQDMKEYLRLKSKLNIE